MNDKMYIIGDTSTIRESGGREVFYFSKTDKYYIFGQDTQSFGSFLEAEDYIRKEDGISGDIYIMPCDGLLDGLNKIFQLTTKKYVESALNMMFSKEAPIADKLYEAKGIANLIGVMKEYNFDSEAVMYNGFFDMKFKGEIHHDLI
jgi:hypothetical protein